MVLVPVSILYIKIKYKMTVNNVKQRLLVVVVKADLNLKLNNI